MLISEKVMRIGFLKSSVPLKFLLMPEFGDTSIEGVRHSIISSMKFVVGRELLAMGHSIKDIQNLLFGKDAQEEYFVPENKKEKLFEMWIQFAKLPYKEIFIENSTGGILLQTKSEGILCTTIHADGEIAAPRAYITLETLEQRAIAAMAINTKLLQIYKNAPEANQKTFNTMMDGVKMTGLVVLNALTYMNSKNVSIEKYNMSRNEAKNKVPDVLLDKYTYHVVDIFHRSKQYEKLSDIEKFANLPMSSNIRAHMVRGHFKQKKNGLYWWNPFLRSKKNEGFVDKDYSVY